MCGGQHDGRYLHVNKQSTTGSPSLTSMESEGRPEDLSDGSLPEDGEDYEVFGDSGDGGTLTTDVFTFASNHEDRGTSPDENSSQTNHKSSSVDSMYSDMARHDKFHISPVSSSVPEHPEPPQQSHGPLCLPQVYKSVDPAIFSQLSFGETRNDESFISFNSNTQSLAYASPERLIVHITSHEVLDYNTMSDYFLTYRLFMPKDHVVELLITRLAWAFSLTAHHQSSLPPTVGYDIAVRTFVVIRHWILNFFGDDFVSSFQSRAKMSDAFNLLYRWKLVQNDVQLLRIMEQLKKAWLRACCMYWNFGHVLNSDSFDLTLPVFPGGAFGQTYLAFGAKKGSDNTARRRLTLLSFYKGPITPMLSSTEMRPTVHNWEAATGSLIRGGIRLSGDVEVSLRRSSDADKRNGGKTAVPRLKSKKSLASFLNSFHPDSSKRGQFTSKVAHMLDLKPRQTSNVEIKIDILSARVIEELDMILKYQEEAEVPVLQERNSNITPASSKAGSIISSRISTSDKSRQYRGTMTDNSRRTSMIDSLRIQDLLANTSDESDFHTSHFRASTVHTSSRTSMHTPVREPHHVPSSPPLDTINSPVSFLSYDSVVSDDTIAERSNWQLDSPITSSQQLPTLRRLKSHGDLRGVINFSRPASLQGRHLNISSVSSSPLSSHTEARSSSTSLDMGDKSLSDKSAISRSLELFNDDGDAWALPDNSGGMVLDPKVAAQLASIPDDTPEEDEIEAALLKLEGQYIKQSKSGEMAQQESKGNGIPLLQSVVPEDIPTADPMDISRPTSVVVQPQPGQPIAFVPEQYSKEDCQYVRPEEQVSVPPSPDFGFSVQYDPSHTSNLYLAAFESSVDISKLERPANKINAEPGPRAEQLHEPADHPREKSSPNPLQPTVDIRRRLHTPTASIDSRPAQDPLSVFYSVSHGNHTPFILNFSPQMLCQHLTLVERDALAEIDWKDLVQLKWNKKLVPIQSWLGLLVEKNVRGVEIVISRFNLVVNWVKSEILLTRSFRERCKTIVHFIDMAYEAKEIQNYATMMQIILALDSVIVQKLNKTWEAVPATHKAKLAAMGEIISPLKNFKNLRMELNSIDPTHGCIPFVGIYLSDLVFNGELPDFVEAADAQGGSGLINFHKFHICASITKSLLQFVEWSRNYHYQPNQDLLAKCLYIHSLTAEEMDLCFDYLIDA